MKHDHHHHDDATLDELRQALTREFWDERYGGSERVWSGRPNQRLVEQTADLTPGLACDIGCGEGADAIWLAEQGWEVTALDVSRVALDRTAQHAIERGVDARVKVGEYDVLAAHPPRKPRHTEGFDLVSAHFMHVPREDFDDVYRRIAAAVAPGGRLLVVAHHPEDVDSGARRPHGPGLLFPPEQLLAAMGVEGGSSDDWEIEVADAPIREQQMDDGPMKVRDTDRPAAPRPPGQSPSRPHLVVTHVSRRRTCSIALVVAACLVGITPGADAVRDRCPATVSTTAAAAAEPEAPQLRRQGRWLIDQYGRVVIVHGFNLVWKRAPYVPPATAAGFTNADARWLKRYGFNGVRLGTLWAGITPDWPAWATPTTATGGSG